jgi:hypothetical protein
MNEIIITNKNADRLIEFGPGMADAYQEAFAGPPWFEASRCANEGCDEGFSPDTSGCACIKCGAELVQAYDQAELVEGWKVMVEQEDAMIELALSQLCEPIRATIARPTTPDELFRRKYAGLPRMEEWLDESLPTEFAWIEDTFANRKKSPTGNLNRRRQTLGRVAACYSGLTIATRTLSPAIVRATVRDVGDITDMYVGTEQVGALPLPIVRKAGSVPDRRTLLSIDGSKLL